MVGTFGENTHSLHFMGIVPVSYTHLDVYKRQVQKTRKEHAEQFQDKYIVYSTKYFNKIKK